MYSGGSRYENPSEKSCWDMCSSCFRCSDKGKYAKCNSCSGRHDPDMKRDPYYIDDRCRCTEGILQYRLQNGQMIVRKFHSSPFAGQVVTDAETEDEQEWTRYIQEQREKLNDPTWDPVQFDDGTSTFDWMRDNRKGR